MLELPEVMLCAADTANVPTTVAALKRSLEAVRFGDAVLFTDEVPRQEIPFRTEIIPPLHSRADYSRFVVTRLGDLTTRKFSLLVQWDGFIVQPSAWRPEFLKYDYIGARWPWHRDGMDVGNGGFCLRSKRLLERVSADPQAAGARDANDDELICRVLRPKLEKEGFRFAPAPVADRFAYERMLPNVETFGFHGLFNMWRHVGAAEMVRLATDSPEYLVRGPEWAETAVIYFNLRKFPEARAFFRRLRAHFTTAQIVRKFGEFLPADEREIDRIVHTLERLI